VSDIGMHRVAGLIQIMMHEIPHERQRIFSVMQINLIEFPIL